MLSISNMLSFAGWQLLWYSYKMKPV